MRLTFNPSPNPRTIQSRRGSNVYREAQISANSGCCEYNPLTNSEVELLEDGKVVGTLSIGTSIPSKAHVQAPATDGRSPEPRTKKKVTHNVQPVVEPERDSGQTLSGADVVQVPSVDEGNARLGGVEERRPEVSTDGVHSDDVESVVVHDRPSEGVSAVSVAVEDTGRDGLLVDEVRSSIGDESVSG